MADGPVYIAVGPTRDDAGWNLGEIRDIANHPERLPLALLASVAPIFRFADSKKPPTAVGTAFYLGPGVAVTARHVVTEPAKDPLSHLPRESELLLASSVVGTHGYVIAARGPDRTAPVPVLGQNLSAHNSDVAMLGVDLSSFPDGAGPVYFSLSFAKPEIGTECLALGYPFVEAEWKRNENGTYDGTTRMPLHVSVGEITELYPAGLGGSLWPQPFFAVSADYPGGMSGGPVFDTEGRVIGVVSTGMSEGTPSGTVSMIGALAILPVPRKEVLAQLENRAHDITIGHADSDLFEYLRAFGLLDSSHTEQQLVMREDRLSITWPAADFG